MFRNIVILLEFIIYNDVDGIQIRFSEDVHAVDAKHDCVGFLPRALCLRGEENNTI